MKKKRNIKNSLIKIHEMKKMVFIYQLQIEEMKLLKIGIKKYMGKNGTNEMIIKYKSSYDGSEKKLFMILIIYCFLQQRHQIKS